MKQLTFEIECSNEFTQNFMIRETRKDFRGLSINTILSSMGLSQF